MVRRDRDWALDAIACLQHGWVACWRLLPCDLPRLAGESEPSQFRPIASRAAIGERPISRMTKGFTSA
jgi:hypothetical protein